MTDAGELFHALFAASPDAVVIADEEGIIRLANDACLGLFGYLPFELEGQPIELLVPSRFMDHSERRAAYLESPRPRGMAAGLELVALHKSGREIPVDIALTPLQHAGKRWVAAAARDMTSRALQGDTLRVQATALRSAANGVVITDRLGMITWVNPAATRITGYGAQELIGQHSRMLKSGAHGPQFYAELWKTVLAGDTWSGTIINRKKDGTLYHEEQTIAPVVNDDDQITHFIAIKQDVTERRRADEALERARADLDARLAEIELLNAQLREQAIRDPLTELFNRRYFFETIGRDISAATRKKEPIALLAIDIDHFKRVNDVHGHAVGDAGLVALAGIIKKCVRGSDIACRFGGEEFVVALLGADLEVARRRAEELRAAFSRSSFSTSSEARVSATVSIGITSLRLGQETIQTALARADAALYEAKRTGRDRVVLVE